MKDRSVQHPDYFRLKKVEGTDDIYQLIPAPGVVAEEGTLINKAALLKDTTAQLFGFGDRLDEVVPDDVLAAIFGKLGDVNDSIAAGPKLEHGSYVGTGTYGQANPVSLAFSSGTKMIFVFPQSADRYTSPNGILIITKGTGSARAIIYEEVYAVSCVWGDDTVSWYTTRSDAVYQMNDNGETYNYIAIG